jgi:hypothetical protein
VHYEDTLPGPERVGAAGAWRIRSNHREGTALVVGRFLGMGSSHKPEHSHTGPVVQRGCAACRWTETRVFSADGGDAPREVPLYLVVRRGATTADGERDRISFTWATGPYQAVAECMTRPRRGDGTTGAPVLTRAAAAALAQAAAVDAGVREAWSAATL